MEIDYEKLEDKLPEDDFNGILVINNETFEDNTNDLEPSDIKENVKEFSEKLDMDTETTFDILSPVFSGNTLEEFYEEKYIDAKKFMNDNKEEGENMSDEEVQELEDKVESLKQELENKEEIVQEYEEEIEEYEKEIQEYEEKERNAIVDNIVSLKEEKNIYDDEDERDEDKEELSEKDVDVLEEVLGVVKDIPAPEEGSSESPSKVQESSEDFDEKEDSKKLEKEMFGDNKAYT